MKITTNKLLPSVIKQKSESQNGCFKKMNHAKFSQKQTFNTYVRVSGGKKCLFFGKFGVFCFLETPVLRFALLPYYQQAIMEMLIKTATKNTGTWESAEKKTSTFNRKINSINYETTALRNSFNAFAASNSEFIEVTKYEEINDKVTTNSSSQKSQSEVKSRPNAAITEN